MQRTIQDIYNQVKVPPNLQRHMLRAAAAAELIIHNWQGPVLDEQKILRVLLLHDIGNIVKMDFNKQPELLEEGREYVNYWRQVQKEYVVRFGKDDHLASHIVASEFGLTEDELDLLDSKIFIKNDLTIESRDYNLKIAAYVDQRIGPYSVMPLLERLREAQVRYKDNPGSSMNNPQTEFLINCAAILEKQIMEFCSLKPEDINDKSITAGIEKLRSFKM